jgi:malonyl-CoA/methylmalonyl-CoA synthetase
MSENLYDVLASGFPADRSKVCLQLETDSLSYGQIEAGAAKVAALLIQKGVRPGDRVAVQAPKSPEALMLYLAVLKAGAVYLPLNTAYTEHEVRYFVEDAEPALFVTDAAPVAREAQGLAPLAVAVPRAGGDLAAIVYTSGTTGRSKGAMVSHRNIAANARALHLAWGFGPGDVVLHALPFFHIHGLFVALHTALLNGSPMIWQARFDVDAVIDALPRATVLMGVPTFYTRLLEHPRFTRASAEHMRLFVCGSAPLLESTFDDFEARTGHRILERYGMSEAGIITSNPLDGARLAGSVGYPLPGVELRIDRHLGGGETGGIEIRGESIFSGYWRLPERIREDFTPDGFFRTGDVGRQDPDGRVWISGRAKDLIISGGFNVYPKEIELVLDALPGVVESAVIAVPHPDFGEAVVAVIAGAGEEPSVIEAARQRLAAFKAPKRVFFVDDLPRNAMGKVQKAALRATYAKLFIHG